MKILLAIDTSPHADATIATVRRMFGSSGASVVVLCVVGENEPETIPSPVLLASAAQDVGVVAGDLVRDHEVIAARAVRMLSDAGFEARTEIRYGDPRHAVLEAARAHAADLIVVGCREHSAVHRAVMGCVATYLIEHAQCDVLVVPHAHQETEEAFRV